jgi:signal peptidase I
MKTKDYIFIKRFDSKEGTFDYKIINVIDGEPDFNLIKTYTPTAGDKIYIFPDSDVPRFKIKGFCDRYNISMSKYKESANILIADPSTLTDDLWHVEKWDYFVSKDYFTNYIKGATRVGDLRYIQLLQDIANNPETEVILDSSAKYALENYGLNGYRLSLVLADEDDDKIVPNCRQLDSYCWIETDEQKQKIAYIESTVIYHRNAILTILNEDVVIDAEMYQGLMNMFESSDQADHRIAMEGMANSDYLKSALYLLFLFEEYRMKIYNSSTKHHVNFKSLCKFFDLRPGDHLDLDEITLKLINKNMLDLNNLNILLELATEEIQNRGNMDSFKISKVEPSPEVLAIAQATTAKNNPVITLTEDNIQTL